MMWNRGLAGRAERVVDRAHVGRAKLEALAGVDLDRVEETPADELAAGDERPVRPHVLLDQPDAVDGCRLARGVEEGGQRIEGIEQLHAQPLAAAVGLEDERCLAEPPRRFERLVAADRGDRAWHRDVGALERCVLRDLADLEIQCAARVDYAAAMPLQPVEDDVGELGREAVVAGVRRRAHAIVEHALGWCRGAVDGALVEEPHLEGQTLLAQRGLERHHPLGVLVQHVDRGHFNTHLLLYGTLTHPRLVKSAAGRSRASV